MAVVIIDGNIGAAGGKLPRDRTADAAGSARDERNLTGERACHRWGVCECGETAILTGPASTPAPSTNVRIASGGPICRLTALRADQPLRFKTPVLLDAVPDV